MKRILLLCFMFFTVFAFTALAQRTVSGKITDETGVALPGVNVVLKGTTTGTTTDLDGNFRLSVEDGAILVISYVGFESQEIEVGARSVIDVTMGGVTELQEVVVVGYGSSLKTELTSSIASVGADQLAKLPTLSPEQTLQGLASGVFVSSGGGQPGSAMNIRVRGQGSINAGTQPLYIIDGVVVSSGTLTQDGVGGAEQSPLSSLNPQDIESMQVLKDAAASAIYGARASNGVVLITTKRGEAGKAKIDFRAWTGMAEAIATYDKTSGAEQIMLEREGFLNDDPSLNPNDPSISDASLGWDGVTNSDWIGEVFREAVIREYQVSATGGNEAFKYFMSGGYRDEEGVMLNSSFERFTTRLNLDYNATDELTIGTSLSFNSSKQNLLQNDNNIFGIYSAAILTSSHRAIRDEETGEFVDGLPSFNTNAVRSALQSKQINTVYKFLGNWNFAYKLPVEGLIFRTDINYDWTYVREDINAPATTAQGRGGNGVGEFDALDRGIFNIEPTFRYTNTFGGDHKITAVAGMTFQKSRRTSSIINGQGFARGTLTYLVSAATITGGESFRFDAALASQFARVEYVFREKYMASALVRRDGSSRFGPDKKFGTFYAFSGGWNFSEEDFFDVGIIDFAKIRGSYGITGNDQIGNRADGFFQYIGTVSPAANYLDQAALTTDRLENPQLQWEQTAMLDVGLEVAMFGNRLNLNVGYFQQKTDKLLFDNQVPWTSGFDDFADNIGKIENKGIEIDLDGIMVVAGDFQWSGKLNLTFLENEVTELNSDEPIQFGFASAVIKGEPLNTFYGLKWLGVDPATGESRFLDDNGDGIISGEDLVVIGDHSPEYMGGINTTLSWKGLSLDAFFQFVQGVDVYNNTLQFSQNISAPWGLSRDVLRRWRQPGDITDIPKATQQTSLDFTNDNSRFLSDGSYIRLKNVTLAYNLPSDLISKAGLRSARVYVQGQNLLTWSGYNGPDPEISAFGFTNTALGTDFLTFPNTRLYALGINIGL